MNPQKSVRAAFILFAMMLCIAYAQAADITIFIGGAKPGSIDYKNLKTPLDSSPVYGARFASSIVPFLGMEHTLAFSADYLFPSNISDIKEAKGVVYSSNLIINVPLKRVSAIPYVTAGVGLMHQYGDSDMPIGTRFAFNYGGGLKVPHVAGRLGLRFDVRGYRVGLISNQLNMVEFSGGLLVSFGVK
jgi:hypothetical protein